MPNIKSAKKRVLTSAKKAINNKVYTSSMKTAMKNVEKAIKEGNKEKANETLKVAVQRIDKACKKGLIKPNKAAREKSRLTKKKNNME